MNVIKQIEASLKAINQAKFQDLINHLLHNQGYKFIGAPGSVVAKEKTSKGIPDSFFESGNKFVFVECTTKEKLGNSKTFIEKLLKDIVHCFDEGNTRINKESIEQIILACTEKISPADLKQLKAKVKEFSIEARLKVYSIQNLPHHIHDFPSLVQLYLGVNIIKGEIYNLPNFLIKTTKGLQPSLVNEFVGREEEIKQSLEYLKSVDILLLSGAAGVGKSKLSVVILAELEKNGYVPFVIQSSVVPLWDDFIHLFRNGKEYVILFDDANKSVQNLTYLLDFVEKPKTNKLKVIITVRDYVKEQVSRRMNNSRYREITVNKLRDKEIEEIVLKALPNLEYRPSIKMKIVELAKGNARLALMATYSATPNSEKNYLNSPVELYEKYFEKISEEIDVFSKPIMLKALAIVSFFGVLDISNNDLSSILKNDFNIDWDELWTAILVLHSHEILDVYTDEIVKVSDQVLATYAFYKCFIDDKTAVINYGEWVSAFIQCWSHRIKNTLIDVNNTFNYDYIKELVVPHLQKVLSDEKDDDKLYSIYSVFWFYQGYDTLIYLKDWVQKLRREAVVEDLQFTYVHNNHTMPKKYFELLVNFWNNNSELLKPAIKLGIVLIEKQHSRLPEFLKFINDYFSYKREDIENGYKRQNTLLDVLLEISLTEGEKKIADGIFLNIIEKLLGWHFTEHGSKGREITIWNFNLYNSPELLNLRSKILEGFYSLFENNGEQTKKILEKIVHPGGNIDKQIYISELPFYERLVSEKLSTQHYFHCKFVKRLSKKIVSEKIKYPKEWGAFINSNFIKLAQFLSNGWEDNKGKSYEERELEKREKIKELVFSKNWEGIKKLLFKIDELYKQQLDYPLWSIEAGVSDVFIAIASKSKNYIQNALRLFFSGSINITLEARVVYYILNEEILSGKELFSLINEYELGYKSFWIILLLNALPENQIDSEFIELLIGTFETSTKTLSIHRMSDFSKFYDAFEEYKQKYPDERLTKHNIISYLTEILLHEKEKHQISLGFSFCQECFPYFTDNLHLLKEAFIYLKKSNNHFDHDGKEFQAVLSLDNNFFIEYLEQKSVDDDYLNFKLEDFKLDVIWMLPDYEEIIKKSLFIIIEKSPYISGWSHPATVLFTFENITDDVLARAHEFLETFINANFLIEKYISIIFNVILHRFSNKFVCYLKQFLLLNKNFEYLKGIKLDKGGIYSGSRVPYIQKEIDFCKEIISMIKTLPNILDYVDHLKYIEQKMTWLKKDIYNEQRRDFEELY